MTSPRMAIFSPSLQAGGAERVVLSLTEGFLQAGWNVHLLLGSAQGEFLADVPAEARIFDFGSPRVAGAYPRLVRYLRRYRPTVLMSTQTHANVVAALAFLLVRPPSRLVLAEHSAISYNLGPPIHPLKGALIRFLAQRLLPRADAIVAVSQGVADDLVRTLGISRRDIRVIYNPIDLQRIQQGARERVEHPWLAKRGVSLVLSVGRLNNAKDYPTLLRAFAILRQRRDARLLILGEGSERAVLEDLARALGIAPWVEMPGYVANPYPYMAAADAFVLSSRWEGFPVVLVEALMCGTPIVSTDCEFGPAEILAGGDYGALVPVGDADALAQAILRTLDDPPDRDRLRQRAREFSFEAAMTQYLNLAQEL